MSSSLTWASRSYLELDGKRWFSHTNGAKTRNASTLVVVLAILATLVALLAPAFMAAMDNPASPQEPPESIWLSTVKHDGHWFVCKGENCCLHHPDCPCRTRTAEAD